MGETNVRVIRLTEETYKRLLRLKGILTAKWSQTLSYDEVVRWLLELAEEKLGEVI